MDFTINTMQEWAAKGENPEVLFWVGCAGSFDERAKKVTKAFAAIMNHVGLTYGILGTEESCTGDPARRAGNEFLFQMLAMNNISVLNLYGVKKIVTACPHCFNILKNEYSKLGGHYEVVHHTQLLQSFINEGKLKLKDGEVFKGKRITYHDSCYLGRANQIYEAPRKVLELLDAELVEMKRCKTRGLCCGAGGAQMFKEDEPGDKRINTERTEDMVESKADFVAVGCPFCNTMLTDGVKGADKQDEMQVLDIAEMIAQSL